jgi:hypothetical protein
MITVFHATSDPEAIQSAGFVNGDGTPGLGLEGHTGVLLTSRPESTSGADAVLAVDLPDDFDLTEFRLHDRPVEAWCVPAELVNPVASVRPHDHPLVNE